MKKTLRPSGGHILDIDSMELGDQFLSRAHNVNTRKGFPSRIGGRRVAYSGTGNAALHLMNFTLQDLNWWLFFRAAGASARQGASETDITPTPYTATTDPYQWTSCNLNGIPVFNNSRDPAWYWDGDTANNALPLPNWPSGTVAQGICAFRFHLFAFNIEDGTGVFENKYLWSDAAEPGTVPDEWAPTAANEAGSAFLADTPGRIVAGLPLGTQLMFYKPSSAYAVEYAGEQPDNIFKNRNVSRAVGALSPNCVLDMGSHLVVGNDDVVITDGTNVRSIADNRIKRYLANQIDETYQVNSFVLRDLAQREVWVCVPESGNRFATVAHIWDERRDAWTTRDLNTVGHGISGFVSDTASSTTWDSDAGTWDSDSSAWTVNSIGTRSRVVVSEPLQAYVEDTSDLATVTSSLQRYDLTFDDDSLMKLTSRVWVQGSGAGLSNLQVRLGARNSCDDDVSIVWGSFQTLSADGVPYEVRGRYISVETQHTGTDTYTVSKIIIEAGYDGSY
jgi:hypothetical protein